jgi:hypothetical protein
MIGSQAMVTKTWSLATQQRTSLVAARHSAGEEYFEKLRGLCVSWPHRKTSLPTRPSPFLSELFQSLA